MALTTQAAALLKLIRAEVNACPFKSNYADITFARLNSGKFGYVWREATYRDDLEELKAAGEIKSFDQDYIEV